jgi:hypothetical protein
MGVAEWNGVALAAIGLVFGLIGWLLANKDKKQADEIAELFRLHHSDSARLQALELDIAKNYNPKHEVTVLFDNFKMYLNERFDRIEHAVGVERRNQQ